MIQTTSYDEYEVESNGEVAQLGKPLVKWIIRIRKKKPLSAEPHSTLFSRN